MKYCLLRVPGTYMLVKTSLCSCYAVVCWVKRELLQPEKANYQFICLFSASSFGGWRHSRGNSCAGCLLCRMLVNAVCVGGMRPAGLPFGNMVLWDGLDGMWSPCSSAWGAGLEKHWSTLPGTCSPSIDSAGCLFPSVRAPRLLWATCAAAGRTAWMKIWWLLQHDFTRTVLLGFITSSLIK